MMVRHNRMMVRHNRTFNFSGGIIDNEVSRNGNEKSKLVNYGDDYLTYYFFFSASSINYDKCNPVNALIVVPTDGETRNGVRVDENMVDVELVLVADNNLHQYAIRVRVPQFLSNDPNAEYSIEIGKFTQTLIKDGVIYTKSNLVSSKYKIEITQKRCGKISPAAAALLAQVNDTSDRDLSLLR